MAAVPDAVRACAVFAGGGVVGLAAMLWAPAAMAWPDGRGVALLVLLGVVLAAVNVSVQYGLARVPANRAVVIYLFELVVTATAAWWLVGDVMTVREWAGGGLIVAAGLASDLARPAKKG